MPKNVLLGVYVPGFVNRISPRSLFVKGRGILTKSRYDRWRGARFRFPLRHGRAGRVAFSSVTGLLWKKPPTPPSPGMRQVGGLGVPFLGQRQRRAPPLVRWSCLARFHRRKVTVLSHPVDLNLKPRRLRTRAFRRHALRERGPKTRRRSAAVLRSD